MDGYFGNAARQFGQGLTFGFSDEMEAAMRAAAQFDPARYREIKSQIEAQRQEWADANPGAAMGAETVGALVPGLAGAFIPGGQGASVGALAQVGRAARAFDAPLERLLSVMAPKTLAVLRNSGKGRLGVALGDEVATGAVQSAGSAGDLGDIRQRVEDDAPLNVAASLGVRGATAGIGRALKKRKR